ncbi:hypothetical protein OH77DRAFT_744268 [Trametes cingulata]|nr:hypothetical protein OH77DRAFT_744268 [Trametes cingulata]
MWQSERDVHNTVTRAPATSTGGTVIGTPPDLSSSVSFCQKVRTSVNLPFHPSTGKSRLQAPECLSAAFGHPPLARSSRPQSPSPSSRYRAARTEWSLDDLVAASACTMYCHPKQRCAHRPPPESQPLPIPPHAVSLGSWILGPLSATYIRRTQL